MSAEHREAWRILMRWRRAWVGAVFDPAYRKIASWFGKSVSQARRYIKDFARWGLLVIEERRCAWNRNHPNVYKLVDSIVVNRGGVPFINEQEKQDSSLKTNAPADAGSISLSEEKPEKPKPQPSAFRLLWETVKGDLKEKDGADRARVKAAYEAKGLEFAEKQGWRLAAAYERTRRAVKASLGVYKQEPATPVEVAEMERVEREYAERAEQEKIAKEVKARATQAAAEAFRRSLEPSPEELAAAEQRIARRLAQVVR